LSRIVELQLDYLRKRLEAKRIALEVSESAKELLLSDGYDEQFGARPMKRAIQRLIQDPLALALLEGEFGEGDTVMVDRDGDRDAMKFSKSAAVEPELAAAG
jgi:ATP-dependent Clp protease ATP-binding subunit ClpB